MCGRYVRKAAKKAIADWFGVDPEYLPEFGPSFNIAPQTFQPVVRLSPETTKQAFAIGMADGSQYAFAGLWESWKEENGTRLETFTIITTDPNGVLAIVKWN